MSKFQTVEWLGNSIRVIDQSQFPNKEVYLELSHYTEMADAIRELKVRGAPAIGVAAAYGIALGALEIETRSLPEFRKKLNNVLKIIGATRPTARNLFQTIDRMKTVSKSLRDINGIKAALVEEAAEIHNDEIVSTENISRLGSEFIKDGSSILTHCNTGPLATTGYGTALGVIIQAKIDGKKIRVFNTETRPLLQGARLTAWELKKARIQFTLITDSMAGYFMKRGEIDCVIVGADRVAANGDTANKIGTYTLAVLAKEHNIPFYVAAPTTTIDTSITTGDEIVIEERNPEEVTHIQGVSIAPAGIRAANPSFDVTPHKYITAIITENGIIREPFIDGI